MATGRNGCLLILGIGIAVVFSAVLGYTLVDFGCSVVPFELGLSSKGCGRWPVEPWGSTHPIGTNGSELQLFDGARFLHEGVDIMEDPQGNWIVAREDGRILSANLIACEQVCELVLVTREEIHERYYHLDEMSVREAQEEANTNFMKDVVLPAGTRLGKVVEWAGCDYHPNQQLVVPFHHLHFEITGRVQYEPLLSLFPIDDEEPPVIDGVWFTANDLVDTPSAFPSGSNATVVHGDVDIVVDAYDRQFANRKTGVLKLQYQIIQISSGEIVKRRVIDFGTIPILSSNGDPASNIYMIRMYDSFGNLLRSKSDYCINDERFLYVLTNMDEDNPTNFEKRFSWNTSSYENGAYRVEITVWDTWNNASIVREVEILN
jgi:hypothetical protein